MRIRLNQCYALFFIVLLTIQLVILQPVDVHAASVFLWNTSTNQNFSSGAVRVGGTLQSIKLRGDNVIYADWRSESPSVFSISGDADGATIRGLREGKGTFSVTIITADHRVFVKEGFVTVYTPMSPTVTGYNTSAAHAFLYEQSILTPQSVTSIPVHTSLTVLGTNGSAYYVRFPHAVTFTDGQSHREGYLSKGIVDIISTQVKLNYSSLTMTSGQGKNLYATTYPSFATNKKYRWKSSNSAVVQVSTTNQDYDSRAYVRAKKAGQATITVYKTTGQAMASCRVKVSDNTKQTKKSTRYRSTHLYLNGRKLTRKYLYSFSNVRENFFYRNQAKAYRLTATQKQKIIRVMAKRYTASSSIAYVNNFTNQRKTSWKGACVGMSISVILNRLKVINIRRSTKSAGKGYALNKVRSPKRNSRVKFLLNYYHVAQKTIPCERIGGTHNKSILSKILSNAKKNRAQAIYLDYGQNTGHMLVAKYYKGKSNGWNYIATYDPQHPKKKSYMRIDSSKRYVRFNTVYSRVRHIGYRANFIVTKDL